MFRFLLYSLCFFFVHIDVRATLSTRLLDTIKKTLNQSDIDIRLDQKIEESDEPITDLNFSDQHQRFTLKVGSKRLSGTLDWKVDLPVLNTIKKPTESVLESDVLFKRFSIKVLNATTCIKKEDLIGKITKTLLKPGLPLSQNDLQNEKVIKKGDLLTITLKRPQFFISTQAIAIDSGGIGDRILVTPIDMPQKRIQVTIDQKGHALL